MTTKAIDLDNDAEDLLAACIGLKERIEKKLKSKKLSAEARKNYEKALRKVKRQVGEARSMV